MRVTLHHQPIRSWQHFRQNHSSLSAQHLFSTGASRQFRAFPRHILIDLPLAGLTANGYPRCYSEMNLRITMRLHISEFLKNGAIRVANRSEFVSRTPRLPGRFPDNRASSFSVPREAPLKKPTSNEPGSFLLISLYVPRETARRHTEELFRGTLDVGS